MLARYDTPNVIVDTMKNIVDVNITFDTGKRYKIGDIIVERKGEGKELVNDQLLKDIVGIKTGQWYSNYDIQRGQVRLYRTELFNSALVNSIISDTSGNIVPINITADVGKLHELSPEIIANNEESFSFGLGLSFIRKNFFGGARKFTVATSAAIQNVSEFVRNPTFSNSTIYGYGDARIILEQPYLFEKPINTRLETYLTAQKRKDEYTSNLYGAKLSLDFELAQYTYFNSFSAYFNVERAKYVFQENYLISLLSTFYQRNDNISVDSSKSKATIFVKDTLGGSLPTSSINALLGFSVGANKTNDLFFPSRGYTLLFQVEDANSIPYLVSKIFGDGFSHPLFFKTVFSSSLYLPVYSSL